MILQTLLFPDSNTSAEEEKLYVRRNKKGIALDTYFNLFSIHKWLRYTVLEELYLRIEAVGSMEVAFSDEQGLLDTISIELLTRGNVDLRVPYRKSSRIITCSISYGSEHCAVYRGAYFTPDDFRCRRIKLALGICTFHREEALKRNLALLKKEVLHNPSSPLHECLDVFISDNGRTLKPEEIRQDHVHVFANRNAGGSGGFTRCLVEVLEREEAEGFTHMIFMDDDVKILPEALIRTYALLSLMKTEYLDAVISGAMLRSDLAYIQHESGALWDGANPRTAHPGLDLRDREILAENEVIVRSDYAAWWFACYPLNAVHRIGLPLPVFIHGDDVEYGLRGKSPVILLNGICVWHEPFENKRASALSYYDVRNTLLLHAIYRPKSGCRTVNQYLFKRMASLLLRYRYKDIQLLCKGVRDFLRGIDWLKVEEPEKLNQRVMHMGYSMTPVQELTHDRKVLQQIREYRKPVSAGEIYVPHSKRHRRKYLLTLNGWLLPAKADRIYSHPLGVCPYEMYRQKKVLLFDPDSKKGILLQKNYTEAVKSLFAYTEIMFCLGFSYKRVSREYHKRFKELTTLDFWKGYLGI
jgi:galactofuranosylgalactofuranosylrhamnosyl-N-acetylglucosaminyl-diphospho-decaprenol beta-1,5/1,6-galactofuranosyltransferase